MEPSGGDPIPVVETRRHPNECRALICDPNGIIIAEMVYRCMMCDIVFESVPDVRTHYKASHLDTKYDSFNKKMQQRQCMLSPTPNGTSMAKANSRIGVSSSTVSSSSMLTTTNGSASYLSNVSVSAKNRIHPTKKTPGQGGGRFSPTDLNNESKGNKSGFLTCAVCEVTKYYAYVQKRFGQYSCASCVKAFWNFLRSPTVYVCDKLGTCPLDRTPRCQACLIYGCLNSYKYDVKKHGNIEEFRPIRGNGVNSSKTTKSKTAGGPNELNVINSVIEEEDEEIEDEMMDDEDEVEDEADEGEEVESIASETRVNGCDQMDQQQEQKCEENAAAAETDGDAVETNKGGDDEHDSGGDAEQESNGTVENYDDALECHEQSVESPSAEQNNVMDNEETGRDEKEENKVDSTQNDESNDSKPSSIADLEGESKSNLNLRTNPLRKRSKSINHNEVSKMKRRRDARVWPCGKCDVCMQPDCGKCINCKDKPKFGGPGVKRKRCAHKICLSKDTNGQSSN